VFIQILIASFLLNFIALTITSFTAWANQGRNNTSLSQWFISICSGIRGTRTNKRRPEIYLFAQLIITRQWWNRRVDRFVLLCDLLTTFYSQLNVRENCNVQFFSWRKDIDLYFGEKSTNHVWSTFFFHLVFRLDYRICYESQYLKGYKQIANKTNIRQIRR